MRTTKKDVKFDKRASKYDNEFEGNLSQKIYQLVLKTVELNPEDKVLDMGCGTGTILYRLSKQCSIEGYGIDIEAKMIEQAKKKCPKMNIQQSDCGQTPFADNMFDSIIACMSFHHFYDQTLFAKEVGRILKSDGIFYLADPCFPRFIRMLINTILKWSNIAGRFCTEKEIVHVFSEAGLKLLSRKRDGFFEIYLFEKI